MQTQCVTAPPHCTLHHKQATSAGRQAVQGPAAPLEGHHSHPVAMQAVYSELNVTNYMLQHQLQHQQAPPIGGQAVQDVA